MEDIIFVKRIRKSGLKMYHNAVVKMESPGGRFLISQKLADILQVDTDDGLMFGFNKKAQTAYVIKDDEPDAFILRRKDKATLRFTSKDLQNYFLDTFNLRDAEKSTFYFDVKETPNEKGFYLLTNPKV